MVMKCGRWFSGIFSKATASSMRAFSTSSLACVLLSNNAYHVGRCPAISASEPGQNKHAARIPWLGCVWVSLCRLTGMIRLRLATDVAALGTLGGGAV